MIISEYNGYSMDDIKRIALKNYNVPGFDFDEFENDFKLLKSIKRDYTIYSNYNRININTSLNKVIILFNIFDTTICKNLLYYYFNNQNEYEFINSFLLILNISVDNKQYNKNIFNMLKGVLKT